MKFGAPDVVILRETGQPREMESLLTVTLHDAQELDDDLRGRADEHLALAATLGIDDVVEAVVLQKPSTLH